MTFKYTIQLFKYQAAALKKAIRSINRDVYAAYRSYPDSTNMGTLYVSFERLACDLHTKLIIIDQVRKAINEREGLRV
jgi:hypothetical protein